MCILSGVRRVGRWASALGFVPSLVVLGGLGLTTSVAQASVKEGHPELYENGKLLVDMRLSPEREVVGDVQVLHGQLSVEGEVLSESGVECAVGAFGSGWNEGTPFRAFGQILNWNAAGHIPIEEHKQLSSSCRPDSVGTYITTEDFAQSEENAGQLVLAKRALSTPWNVEYKCGVREAADVAMARIGVPSMEFPRVASPCPRPLLEEMEAEERELIEIRKESEMGPCYGAKPRPPGCLRLDVVEPAAGSEFAFGGTLYAHVINGVHNGLTPTRWVFEGFKSGVLRCEFPEGCESEFTVSGELLQSGYSDLGLVQLK